MEQKPKVMPTRNEMNEVMSEQAKIAAYETEKALVTNEIYQVTEDLQATPTGHLNAIEAMKSRTFNQLQSKQENGEVIEPELAETSANKTYMEATRKKHEEQMRLRDEQLAMNKNQTQKFQQYTQEAENRHLNVEKPVAPTYNQNNNVYTPPPTVPPVMQQQNFGPTPSGVDPYILEISQPNYNSPFDVIPLPSGGKQYRNKKANIKLAFMTTADENILSSPNLLQSGEFLEILINRKILEPTLRYKDLLPGDRNAIMIWLRATGHGEMYPITVLDNLGVPFDVEFDLNKLKTIESEVESDEEGLFTFTLPTMKNTIKFKLLTCGEIDDLNKLIEFEEKNGILINNTNTYKLEKMIVEVDGSRNRDHIREFVNIIRVGDARKLDEFILRTESGIDLNIEVTTPGGESVATFLPLNINFFWPNI